MDHLYLILGDALPGSCHRSAVPSHQTCIQSHTCSQLVIFLSCGMLVCHHYTCKHFASVDNIFCFHVGCHCHWNSCWWVPLFSYIDGVLCSQVGWVWWDQFSLRDGHVICWGNICKYLTVRSLTVPVHYIIVLESITHNIMLQAREPR